VIVCGFNSHLGYSASGGPAEVGSKDRQAGGLVDCRLPTPGGLPGTRSRGPAATTPGPHPGNDGSSPSGITHLANGAAGPRVRHRYRTPGIGVQIPGGPLNGPMVQREDASSADWRSGFDSRWVHWPRGTPRGAAPAGRDLRLQRKVAGYGWPDRPAKVVLRMEMRVRLPCLPLPPRW
jgi:hypothetical protein